MPKLATVEQQSSGPARMSNETVGFHYVITHLLLSFSDVQQGFSECLLCARDSSPVLKAQALSGKLLFTR